MRFATEDFIVFKCIAVATRLLLSAIISRRHENMSSTSLLCSSSHPSNAPRPFAASSSLLSAGRKPRLASLSSFISAYFFLPFGAFVATRYLVALSYWPAPVLKGTSRLTGCLKYFVFLCHIRLFLFAVLHLQDDIRRHERYLGPNHRLGHGLQPRVETLWTFMFIQNST